MSLRDKARSLVEGGGVCCRFMSMYMCIYVCMYVFSMYVCRECNDGARMITR